MLSGILPIHREVARIQSQEPATSTRLARRSMNPRCQRLQQLLGNLVLNAIKYGAQDTPVRVILTGDITHVRIDVCNCGAAIEPATLACIFDPLERGRDRQSQDEKATSLGLGLYIASEIAMAHHGAIETRSDETETTFYVSLPRMKP
jgi:signal transduction histidine kinase